MKLSPKALKESEIGSLKKYKLLKDFPLSSNVIHSVRVNIFALSCIVEYDKNVIPYEAWKDLLEGAQTEASGILLNIINDLYRSVKPETIIAQ